MMTEMKRIMPISRYLLLIMLIFCLASPVQAEQSASGEYPAYYGVYGSAKFIAGTTIVISIFADDMNTRWDFSSDYDLSQRSTILYRMQTGLAWLSEQVGMYGVYSEIISDYSTYSDLYYTHSFAEDLINGSDRYKAVYQYIRSNIDIESVMNAHQADDIVFFIHLNAPSSDSYRSFTIDGNYRNVEEDECFLDICYFVPYGHGVENTPAVYAHEFMHCFGAVDLYLQGDQITQTYADYLAGSGDFDIMRQCYWSDYNQVTNVFSDVDAYYMGLLNSCTDVENFGLGKSSYSY